MCDLYVINALLVPIVYVFFRVRMDDSTKQIARQAADLDLGSES